MALLNLEKKGILQTQRSSVQVMASSILGSAYLVRLATPIIEAQPC